MALQLFCPKWYYHFSLTDDQRRQTNELFDDFLNNDDNFHQPTWNCSVQSSFHDKETNGPWAEWLQLISPVWTEFTNEMVFPKVTISPNNAWINKYDSGDSQEVHEHAHPTSNLVMTYFHTLNDDDGCDFMFYNTEHTPYGMMGLDNTIKLPSTQVTVPKIKSGDGMIFPANYLHLVSPHKGTKTRVTFSLNFHIHQ